MYFKKLSYTQVQFKKNEKIDFSIRISNSLQYSLIIRWRIIQTMQQPRHYIFSISIEK